MTIAKLNNPIRFGDYPPILPDVQELTVHLPTFAGGLPTSYWVTPDLVASQPVFYRYLSFDPAVILAAEANKGTITLGEVLTQNANIARNYTNPVLAVTGDRD
ncbi:hypothetical protein BKA70DRAFT_1450238 [Coprinopsis sp. MPI-PUGE-AT-0042]|nr:hypothetical protein BKA70DRAFT_1450238 [Coprinopsis sp. MPI-PUGE-AT-0042]